MNWPVVGMVVLALATALGLNVAFKNRVVIESGQFIREDEAPYLYRMARWRLVFMFGAFLAGGLALAESTLALGIELDERFLSGIAAVLMSLVAGNILLQGFHTGEMRNGSWIAPRSEPDFWVMAGFLSISVVLTGGMGLLLVLGNLR